MTVTAAPRPGLFGVAVTLGKTNAVEFCNFMDYQIKRYPSGSHIILEPYSIENDKDHALPRSQTDQLLAKIVRAAEVDGICRSLDDNDLARNTAVSLAKRVPVVFSYTGEVGEDSKTITPRGFKINDRNDPINLEEHLNRLAPDGLEFNVTVLSPAEALIKAAAIYEKNLLRAGDQIYSAIIDTGMSGASGTIAADGTLTQISVNDKAGHEKMPYVKKFKLIEGERGEKGHVARYITANDLNNHSRKKRGLMATVENFKQLTQSKYHATLTAAVKLLNDTLQENGVGDDLSISNQDVKLWDDDEAFPRSVKNYFTITNQDVLESSIMNNNKEFSDQEIIQAAKKGDKFAQALVIFTFIRVSQALAQSINSQIPNKQPSGQLSLNLDGPTPPIKSDKPVQLLFVTSSFNRDLSEIIKDYQGPELQSRVIQSELRKLGHPGILCPGQSLHHFNLDLNGTPLIVEEQLKEAISKDLKTPRKTAQ